MFVLSEEKRTRETFKEHIDEDEVYRNTQKNIVSTAIFFAGPTMNNEHNRSGSYFGEGGVKIFGKLLFVCQVLNLRLVLIARGGRLDNKLLEKLILYVGQTTQKIIKLKKGQCRTHIHLRNH